MQAFYPERFEREMGCTEAEWLMWLPQAIGEHHWKLHTGAAGVRIGDGALGLKWQVVAPRVIGLIRIPVLRVSFRFAGLDDAQRYTFMKRFDLYMQRGGG
ncbi:hypothetical protein MIZ03_1430 [Rhodoferax lithotrophicus]|uniref:Uncharacterized protein n=1 Tax=Rhodoferax lithotrophicus TaxID=2798804 RepID=A0ABN6D3G9_9BURK|nr:hypothetical protein [Rhodoferax sp. MIZ03]BCO26547.1 hypothetical protein MIZ03_1430 [Rhodoferax sp. MIZ03]